MKIVVTSDIHGSVERLNYILKSYPADYYLDCGDSELSTFELGSFVSVKGNCDFENFPNYRIITIDDNLKIFMNHGNRFSKERMIALAKENDCKIVLYGHTHVKAIEEVKGIYLCNPGSVSRPRKGNNKTFLVINYDNNTLKVDFEFVKINL